MPANRSTWLVRATWVSAAFCGLAIAAVSAHDALPRQEQKPPAFRGRTTVVPIDVRVLDRNGKPVTDLKPEEFRILENGLPQKIEYFSAQALTPAPPDPDVTVRPAVSAPVAALAPQSRRLFLIYLGRGRLQEPSKGLDATLRFVRDRLLPQDQVAVMAWNRATDFTSDKKRVVSVIERFRTAHEEIEHEVSLYFSGLFGLYGGREVPPHIQTLIDKVFDEPTAGVREVLPAGNLRAAQNDVRQAVDQAFMRSDIETFRMFGGRDVRMADGMFDINLNMSFEDYIVLNRQTMQDVGNLYAGIDYLRFIEGEKHLIFVTEQGFYLPRTEYEDDLASTASDARVALDTIQTGGVAATQDAASGVVTVTNGWQLVALREMSNLSGGQSSVSRTAEAAFDRILASTEFGYLLGYSPTQPATDSRRRKITVEVTRRGLTISHRKAYVPMSESERFDPRESLARTRLVSAASIDRELADLKFESRLLDVKEGQSRFLNVEVNIDASRVRLARVGNRYVAALNFAILCGDYYEKDVGQLWESKDVFVPETQLAEVKQKGLLVTLKVPVKQIPVYVKIIAYDYGSDLLGAKVVRSRIR
jgi:VWFA-related protein